MVSASVIIVSHRPHRWLRQSIASVAAQAREILVVDNGSGGAVAEIGDTAGATVLSLPRNVGFPAAVNHAAARATGELIALLNDDAFAGDGWLDHAATALEDPAIGAVTPKLVFALPYAEIRFDDEPRFVGSDPRPLGRALRHVHAGGVDVLPMLVGPGIHRLEDGELEGKPGPWRWTTGRDPIYVPLPEGVPHTDVTVNGEAAPVVGTVTLINSAGTYLSRHGFGGDFAYGSPDDGTYDHPAERFGACGAALVTTAGTWRRLGGFAAGFFAYYEDLDWSWRVRLAGMSIRYDPMVTVRHVGGATTGGPASPQVQALAARNRLLCLARNAPLRVLSAEMRRDVTPRASRRALLQQLPRALMQRRSLRHSWQLQPHEIWDRWAGRDERWPASAPS